MAFTIVWLVTFEYEKSKCTSAPNPGGVKSAFCEDLTEAKYTRKNGKLMCTSSLQGAHLAHLTKKATAGIVIEGWKLDFRSQTEPTKDSAVVGARYNNQGP